MTDLKITAGTWYVREGSLVYAAACAERPYSVRVADCYGYKEQREADARLIAVSPALLDQLEAWVSHAEAGLIGMETSAYLLDQTKALLAGLKGL